MTMHARAILVAVSLAINASALAASPAAAPAEVKSHSLPPSVFEERPIDWRTLVPDIYRDQKSIWSFPVKLSQGRHWEPALGLGVVLGGLIALDSRDTPYFRNHNSSYAGFNGAFTNANTEAAVLLLPVAFYGLGTIRKDSYETHTSLLAGESIVDSEILAYVIKTATGRRRPGAVPLQGNYNDTWFETYHPPLRSDGGFPSGHAVLAFSVATIFARRYASHRWVPWLAYGAATLVAFSRLTQQAHFPSDVFAGAAFGYVISRYVVMPGREPEP